MILEVGDLTRTDRAANAAALFMPATEPRGGDGYYGPPCVEVGGVVAAVYARQGVLVLEIDMDKADPEVWQLTPTGDGRAAVAMAVSIGEGRPLIATPEAVAWSYAAKHSKDAEAGEDDDGPE